MHNKFSKKNFFHALTVVLIFWLMSVNTYAAGQISLVINGEAFQAHDANGNEIYPLVYENRTYLPVRAIAEVFGKPIDWDGFTNTVYIGNKGSGVNSYSDEVRIVLDGSIFVYYDENGTQLKPIIVNETSYLPLRGAAMAFNKQIEWSAEERTVYITDKEESISLQENSVQTGDLRSVLAANIENYNTEEIDISEYNISCDELKTLVSDIVNRPEFYYVASSFMYSHYDNIVQNVRFDYTIGKSIVEQARQANASGEYKILFIGDWDSITDSTYKDRLENIFYEVYPRLVRRWGDENTSKAIILKADKNFDMGENVVGFTHGYLISFSTAFANKNPRDVGFFAHELTHAVQQYIHLDSSWWTENMANYGRFRYYHWAGDDLLKLDYYSPSVRDWNYEPYGNCMWFFAYMDSKYPTVKNADGSLEYGLIDSLNRAVRSGRVRTDGGSTQSDADFNSIVSEITGFPDIDSLREQYIKELNDKSWLFTGFDGYADNFITENIPGVKDPVYNRP